MAKDKLETTDGKIFEVDMETAKSFGPIKEMLEHEIIPLCTVNSDYFRHILKFFEYHKNHPLTVKELQDGTIIHANHLSEWDEEFIKDMSSQLLFDIMNAANYLNYENLIIVTCKMVTEMIKAQSPEQIRKHFDIPEEREENY